MIHDDRACPGCGCLDVEARDAYAAVEGISEIEVVEWRCAGCGERSETTRLVA